MGINFLTNDFQNRTAFFNITLDDSTVKKKEEGHKTCFIYFGEHFSSNPCELMNVI